MRKILHQTSKIITFVDPVTNDPYADIAVRTAGSYRDPMKNSIRKLPKQKRELGGNGKTVKRKVRSHAGVLLRRARRDA